jgi:hypothetical protein
MKTEANISIRFSLSRTEQTSLPAWQRVALLIVLGYEALGCLAGGVFLTGWPDGRVMQMPVEIMHGFFSDFFVPGLILFGLGVLNTIAFFTVLRRAKSAWLYAWLASAGLAIWFIAEILILQELHWLHAMWGLPVVVACLLSVPMVPQRNKTITKLMLWCGMAAALWYAGLNILVPLQWPGYHLASQTVSELSAIGAPTRLLWALWCIPFTVFSIAFGCGILRATNDNSRLRIAGWLLLVYALLGVLWPFAPMHLREDLAAGRSTWSDTIHLGLGAITELLFMLALIFSSLALGKAFRMFSILVFAALLVFGILTFVDAPHVSLNEPTPYIGLWERINIGVFLLWTVVLAIVLLPLKNHRPV